MSCCGELPPYSWFGEKREGKRDSSGEQGPHTNKQFPSAGTGHDTPSSLGILWPPALQLLSLRTAEGDFDLLPFGESSSAPDGLKPQAKRRLEGHGGTQPGGPGPPARQRAPLAELLVLQLQVAVQGLQAAVLVDEGLVLGGLPLVQRPQVLVVLQQRLVGGRQLLLLLLQALVLALLGRLLALQQCVLGAE